MALTTFVQNSLPSIDEPTYFKNGLSLDVNEVQFPLQIGVPVSPIYTFKVVPVSSNAGNEVSPAFNFGTGTAGGVAPLNTAATGTAPNIASIPYEYNGENGVLLDCERSIVWFSDVVTTQAFKIILKAYDFRGVLIQWTSPTINVGAQLLVLSPPVSLVVSVTFTANPLSGVTGQSMGIGTTDNIGLPYFLPNASFVIGGSWANNPFATDGTVYEYGYNWRQQATLSSTYTSARGFVNIGSTPANNTNVLVATYYVYGADAELNKQIEVKNQSQLKVVGVKKNTSSAYPTTNSPLNQPVFVYPNLVPQDLTGVQLNPGVALATTSSDLGGDSVFMLNYNALVAG
jgi:hypothetical protein